MRESAGATEIELTQGPFEPKRDASCTRRDGPTPCPASPTSHAPDLSIREGPRQLELEFDHGPTSKAGWPSSPRSRDFRCDPVVDQSRRDHGQPIKGLLLPLAAWPMGELNSAVQLAVLLRGVRDGRVGFAAAGDFKRVIGLV